VRNLQRKQFHGTPRQIDDTHIRPSSHTGADALSSRGFSSGAGKPAHTDMAFATHGEEEAWSYAINTGSRSMAHPENHDPDPRYRSRVYEVEPAHDQYQEGGKYGEIQSETGYGIKRAIHARVGETGTFPKINWNAFKAPSSTSPRHTASNQDFNHSYMQDQSGVVKPPHVPRPFNETKDAHDNRYNAPDHRDPDQLNLFTGKSVSETDHYVRQPGYTLMQSSQFEGHDIADFHRDPTTSARRALMPAHKLDVEFSTVR